MWKYLHDILLTETTRNFIRLHKRISYILPIKEEQMYFDMYLLPGKHWNDHNKLVKYMIYKKKGK